MSDGNRGGLDKALIGAIVTAIALVGMYWAMFYDAGYQLGRHQERAQIERKHYAADTSKRVERECSGKLAVALQECVAEIVTSEHENKRNESDLAAQWQAADWVFWASIIAGAQLVTTVIGLYFIKGTLDATLKAVEDTGKATTAMLRQNELTEHAQRPWIKISAELISVKSTERRIITIDWRVKFENIGQMVAHNFQPLVKFVPMDEQFLTSIAAHMDSFPGKLQEIDSVLIPKDENVYKGRSSQAIEYLPWQTRDGYRKDCVLMLIAMARYRIPGDDKWRVSMQGFAIAEALGNVDDCHFTYDFPDDLSIETMHVRKLGRSRAT